MWYKQKDKEKVWATVKRPSAKKGVSYTREGALKPSRFIRAMKAFSRLKAALDGAGREVVCK
jgi:hypothetical protein